MHVPNLVRSANFAFNHHLGQFRDDGKTPFFTHLVSVTNTLLESGVASHDVLMAGYLHDVVEDTPVTIHDIKREFGERVSTLVFLLTDPDGVRDLDARDLQLNRAKNSWFCPCSASIKIADKTANVLDTLNAPWSNDKRMEYVNSSISIIDAMYFSLKSRHLLNEHIVWLWTNFRECSEFVIKSMQ